MKHAKKVITLLLVTGMLINIGFLIKPTPLYVKANNVFDMAEDWEPLQLKTIEAKQYYRINISQAMRLRFVSNDGAYISPSIKVYTSNGDLYATIVGEGQYFQNSENMYIQFKPGTYYLYSEESQYTNPLWYIPEDNLSLTDMNIEENTKGTIFEDSFLWNEMTAQDFGTVGQRSHAAKIVLFNDSNLEFRYDEYESNWPSYLYDSHGRICYGWRYGSELSKQTYELEAGTYFLVTYDKFTNLYYRLSASKKATFIKLNQTSLTLEMGETATLKYTIQPSNCTDIVNYKSTDDRVALVNNNGVVKAINTGNCVIQATTGSGKVALCEINVKKAKQPSKISFVQIAAKKSGNSKQYTISWKPVSNANGYQVYYSSSSNGKYKKLCTTSNIKVTLKMKYKKYYFKVRAYRKIFDKKVYGSFSKVVKK